MIAHMCTHEFIREVGVKIMGNLDGRGEEHSAWLEYKIYTAHASMLCFTPNVM